MYISLSDLEEKTHICNGDLLACSAAAYRLREFGRPVHAVHGQFTALANELTPVDHELAALIRGYYSKKLVSASLKNGNLSEFRSKLAKFLQSGGRHYNDPLLRLVYKLPEFYYYDVAFDSLADKASDTPFTRLDDGVITVQPELKLLRSTQATKCFKYWCTIGGSGNLACISISSNNPLLPIWDNIYFRKEPLEMEAKSSERVVDGRQYHEIGTWRLIGNVSVD